MFHKLVNCVPTPTDGYEWVPPEDRRVGLTERAGVTVSTVFLQIDHGFGGTPLWFETMVFRNGEADEEFTERYTTYEEAEAGHRAICEKVFGPEWPDEIR